jgi:GTP-binding protein YchF
MSLQCGIVGLPNAGKSTLFNALTAASVPAENYPFCTVEPHHGIVMLPDPQLNSLAKIYLPQKVTPATVEFTDIAGLVKGASHGEGLGNQFLGQIKQVQAIISVVRCFFDSNVAHTEGSVDPVRDAETIETELLLKDLETIQKRTAAVKKNAKSGDKSLIAELELLERIEQHCNSEEPIRTIDLTESEAVYINDMFLLTAKPILHVANIDESQMMKDSPDELSQRIAEYAQQQGTASISLCAQVENEIAQLQEDEKLFFLKEYQLAEPGLNRLIRHAFKLLKLITFYTGNENEVRSWTLPANGTAIEAANEVHSDFAQGFIKTDVYKVADLIQYGSELEVREAGHSLQVGREYVVQDGDCLYFRSSK